MGRVYIVGAGPGDPELLTLKAARIISQADVILCDRLISPDILRLARPDCKLVYVGKEDGKHLIPQEEINKLLFYYAVAYRIVVRLKGGDPFVFGRGGEEVLYLSRRSIPCEVVPGISSVYSVPACAGIPVTFRGISSSFAVVTGHEATCKKRTVDWKAFANVDTLIILMGVKNRRNIARELLKAGREPSEPVAFVEKGTTSDQRVIITDLGTVAREPPDVVPPAVMIVGDVVRLHSELHLLSDKREEILPGDGARLA